jgi:hypothetical protein
MPYRYDIKLTEAERLKELNAILVYGNHKSAADKPTEVSKLLLKDVVHGFLIPGVLPEIIPKLLKALVQPMGMAKQTSLNSNGNQYIKCRLPQDLSYSLTSKRPSINS